MPVNARHTKGDTHRPQDLFLKFDGDSSPETISRHLGEIERNRTSALKLFRFSQRHSTTFPVHDEGGASSGLQSQTLGRQTWWGNLPTALGV